MEIELIEKNDWDVNPNDEYLVRFNKSVEAYYLNNWYEKLKDITFETFMYDSIDSIPEKLPFDKCMVRWQNKSPKDSEFWNHVSTKKELLNLFHTSLRCRGDKNKNKIYCVRKWQQNLEDEFRCFWNETLVAISSESNIEPQINDILKYINTIAFKIPYYRCVFDIAKKDNNEFVFIEFNSWESNSGGHRFNWIDDTKVFYEAKYITVRWLNGETHVPFINYTKIPIEKSSFFKDDFLCKPTNFDGLTVLKPQKPSSWLVTKKYVYIANDIWLGRFTHNLKPINWTRGIFRFNSLQLCEDEGIYAEPKHYYYDLTPKKINSGCVITTGDEYPEHNYRYGCMCKDKEQDVYVFCVLLSNCTLKKIYIKN